MITRVSPRSGVSVPSSSLTLRDSGSMLATRTLPPRRGWPVAAAVAQAALGWSFGGRGGDDWATSHLSSASSDTSAPAAQQAATSSPATVPGARARQRPPAHVLQPDQAHGGLVHSPDAGHPWPGQQWQSNPRGPAENRRPQNQHRRHLPDQPGMLMQPWNPGMINRRSSLHEPATSGL